MQHIFMHFINSIIHGNFSHKLLIDTLLALKQDHFEQDFMRWMVIFTIVDVVLLILHVRKTMRPSEDSIRKHYTL